MVTQALSVMRREGRRRPLRLGDGAVSIAGNILAIGFVVFLLPYLAGPGFIQPVFIVPLAVLSVFLVADLVADTFASKKGRADLSELASCGVPRRAIIIGKIVSVLSLGWGGGLAFLAACLVSLNLSHRYGSTLLPPAAVLGGAVALSLAAALLVAEVGALLASRSPDAHSVQRDLKLLLIVTVLVLIDAFWFLPAEWTASIGTMDTGGIVKFSWVMAAALLALAAVLFPRVLRVLSTDAQV